VLRFGYRRLPRFASGAPAVLPQVSARRCRVAPPRKARQRIEKRIGQLMTTRSAKAQRQYSGPAVFSVGFRPFFLLAGLWATLAMGLWVMMLSGALTLPTAFDPIAWHAHELIFGYGGAVVCGFLLTAIPNWTGRLPVTGAPLAGLAAIWVAGRVAVTFGDAVGPFLTAAVDLAFLASLVGIVAREIIAGNNRRNLPVLALCLLFLVANALFHWVAMADGAAASESGARLGIATLVTLITLIGGRIIPSFTRNWLARQGPGALPTPMGRFDAGVIAATVVTLASWVALPESRLVGGMMLLAGIAHLIRLSRWTVWRCASEPLVWVLHLGYSLIPLGFLLVGASAVWPDVFPTTGTVHAWLAGAVGLMTLAVMTRASLGHSGRPLTAGKAETTIYLLIYAAMISRLAAGFGGPDWMLDLAGGCWIAGFGLFSITYWPILTGPRIASKKPSTAR